MGLIELTNGGEISTLSANEEGLGTITISVNKISKGMAILNANELALLIRDLKRVYLSIAEMNE